MYENWAVSVQALLACMQPTIDLRAYREDPSLQPLLLDHANVMMVL